MLKTIVATFQTVMGSSLSQQSAVEIIHQWRSRPSHELIFDAGRREISQYLQAVDLLQQSRNVKGFDELLSVALTRLRSEFIAVLNRQSEHQAGPISTTEWSVTDSTAYTFRYEDYAISEPPSDYVITYLRNIVERMKLCGKIGECVEAYKSVRRNFLQIQLKQLRYEELGINYNTRRYIWDELKVKMEIWIQVSKICVKILFEKEKQLSAQIFDDAFRDECFIGTVRDFATGLFSFTEAMSLSNQTYDKMEDVLGLYDAFLWVFPYANALFNCESSKGVWNTCSGTLSRIESEVGRMLYDFEYAILMEVSDVFDHDRGVVDQSTCFVMDQVDIIVRHTNLLTNLIKTTPLLKFGDREVHQDSLGDFGNHSFLELHLILILVVLQMNLETKSRSYKNPCLGQLFMMNNVRYILQKISGSKKLQEMVGDSYMRKLHENLEVAKNRYETSTCNKFLACFKDEGLYITRCFKSQPSRAAVRKRIKNFNAAFEEIRVHHSAWRINDLALRENIRDSMSRKLVRAYKVFIEKFGSYPEIKLLMEKNLKYSVEDLEALVSKDLFANN